MNIYLNLPRIVFEDQPNNPLKDVGPFNRWSTERGLKEVYRWITLINKALNLSLNIQKLDYEIIVEKDGQRLFYFFYRNGAVVQRKHNDEELKKFLEQQNLSKTQKMLIYLARYIIQKSPDIEQNEQYIKELMEALRLEIEVNKRNNTDTLIEQFKGLAKYIWNGQRQDDRELLLSTFQFNELVVLFRDEIVAADFAADKALKIAKEKRGA